MFFHERLIISYVQYLENDRYVFQLTEGAEFPVSREEFMTHYQEYRKFEDERARASQQHAERYRPLPVTLVVRRCVKVFPANPSLRRKRRSA
ncbi:hypothetical protein [Desulfitobacterium metallireducens]|uniref:Uncharacterized protein n=1 Tax=Desulfitobacterium metallireducens DSM 15288 TaxID=871968 RepID=W0EF51_9FIRM|nr:hypothetical protein [Desulfitobacterium metallireducens]AHF07819.1 hypothetical protein DESME_12875 [Desulfitobacterium metallireducens DSM 15288]